MWLPLGRSSEHEYTEWWRRAETVETAAGFDIKKQHCADELHPLAQRQMAVRAVGRSGDQKISFISLGEKLVCWSCWQVEKIWKGLDSRAYNFVFCYKAGTVEQKTAGHDSIDWPVPATGPILACCLTKSGIKNTGFKLVAGIVIKSFFFTDPHTQTMSQCHSDFFYHKDHVIVQYFWYGLINLHTFRWENNFKPEWSHSSILQAREEKVLFQSLIDGLRSKLSWMFFLREKELKMKISFASL